MQITFDQVKEYAKETNYKMPILVDLKAKQLTDDFSDISYLDEDNDSEYAEQNAERKAEYGRSWWHVGIQVEATIMVPVGNGSYHTHELTSGGLWGIESDSDTSYFRDVAADEWYQLKQELEMMNVYIPNEIEITEV